jgi:hypothetical protein
MTFYRRRTAIDNFIPITVRDRHTIREQIEFTVVRNSGRGAVVDGMLIPFQRCDGKV